MNKKKIQYFLFALLSILFLFYCNDSTTESADDSDKTKFSVTYKNTTPSSNFLFITTYNVYDTLLLEWTPVTHTDIDTGHYRLQYWKYTDAGMTAHKNGHFYVAKNCTIDLLIDLDDLKDGNTGF